MAPTDADPQTSSINLVRRRTPRTEAVIISKPKEGESYVSVMKRVVAGVNLNDAGIKVGKIKRTLAGAILVEMQGKEEADNLVSLLRNAIGDAVQVNRPSRRMKVMLLNIPEWVEAEEVATCL